MEYHVNYMAKLSLPNIEYEFNKFRLDFKYSFIYQTTHSYIVPWKKKYIMSLSKTRLIGKTSYTWVYFIEILKEAQKFLNDWILFSEGAYSVTFLDLKVFQTARYTYYKLRKGVKMLK